LAKPHLVTGSAAFDATYWGDLATGARGNDSLFSSHEEKIHYFWPDFEA
jgi:hypothetical protein